MAEDAADQLPCTIDPNLGHAWTPRRRQSLAAWKSKVDLLKVRRRLWNTTAEEGSEKEAEEWRAGTLLKHQMDLKVQLDLKSSMAQDTSRRSVSPTAAHHRPSDPYFMAVTPPPKKKSLHPTRHPDQETEIAAEPVLPSFDLSNLQWPPFEEPPEEDEIGYWKEEPEMPIEETPKHDNTMTKSAPSLLTPNIKGGSFMSFFRSGVKALREQSAERHGVPPGSTSQQRSAAFADGASQRHTVAHADTHKDNLEEFSASEGITALKNAMEFVKMARATGVVNKKHVKPPAFTPTNNQVDYNVDPADPWVLGEPMNPVAIRREVLPAKLRMSVYAHNQQSATLRQQSEERHGAPAVPLAASGGKSHNGTNRRRSVTFADTLAENVEGSGVRFARSARRGVAFSKTGNH